jgi:hypothetical protein
LLSGRRGLEGHQDFLGALGTLSMAARSIRSERRHDYWQGLGPLYPGNEQASCFVAITEEAAAF